MSLLLLLKRLHPAPVISSGGGGGGGVFWEKRKRKAERKKLSSRSLAKRLKKKEEKLLELKAEERKEPTSFGKIALYSEAALQEIDSLNSLIADAKAQLEAIRAGEAAQQVLDSLLRDEFNRAADEEAHNQALLKRAIELREEFEAYAAHLQQEEDELIILLALID